MGRYMYMQSDAVVHCWCKRIKAKLIISIHKSVQTCMVRVISHKNAVSRMKYL